MRERKRLETLLADDAELARRQDDIEAYFELAKEGEATEPDLEREIPALIDFSGPQEGFAITLYLKALGHDIAAAEENWGSALSDISNLLRSRAFAT